MMKAILISKWLKGIDDITISEVPKPQSGSDEVLVKVHAAGVNFIDQLYIRGKHQNNTSLIIPPFILGVEFAGTVISSPFPQFSPGDRVFGSHQGCYASFISVPRSSLHRIPNGWSFADAAGLAATAPVGYGALVVRAGLKRGEVVLVHGASGGLGLMAVQIAKAVGAKVIATSASDEKLEVCRHFGADGCVNYENPEWYQDVLKLTNGAGVDVVYDSVGLVDKSLKCLRSKGRILIIGFAGTEGAIEKIAMNRILLRQAQIIGYRMGATARGYPAEPIEIWRGLKEMWESGLLKPTVYDRQYKGLESVKAAMKDLQARKVWGKAVVLLDGENDVEKAKI